MNAFDNPLKSRRLGVGVTGPLQNDGPITIQNLGGHHAELHHSLQAYGSGHP